MTAAEVRQWLSARRPAPPPELAAHLESLLTASTALTASTGLSEALAAIALEALHGLDGRDPRGESVAMDLLAADAFVTYAFEAAAEADRDVGGLAEAVLARLEA